MGEHSPNADHDLLLGLTAALGLTTVLLPWAEVDLRILPREAADTHDVRLFGLSAPTWFQGLLAAGAPGLVLALRRHGRDVSPSLARAVTHALSLGALWVGIEGPNAGLDGSGSATDETLRLAILSGLTSLAVLLRVAGRLRLAVPLIVGLPAALLAWSASSLDAAELAPRAFVSALCVMLASELLIAVMVLLPPGRRPSAGRPEAPGEA